MNPDKIIITENKSDEPGESFSAHVEGIACAGTGKTKEEAVHSLANVLADFVKGHAGTIDHMRIELRAHAGKLSELADPKLQYDSAPAIGFPSTAAKA